MTGSRGPVRTAERSLAPDLARGLALLGIALANCVALLSGSSTGPLLRPVDGSTLDRVVDAVVGLLIDNRAFPMFTLLFAYGFVMLARRQEQAGAPWGSARGVLLRRSAWLIGFGAAHTVLLFFGDIVLSYGFLGLALVLALRWSDRALLLVGAAALVVFIGFGALDGLPDALDQSLGGLLQPDTVLGALLFRLIVLAQNVVTAPLFVVALAPPAVVGLLWARRGVLEQPENHLPMLRRVAVGGLAVSILGAVPLVLSSTRLVEAPLAYDLLAAALHGGTGLAGAVAFAAGVGWFAGIRRARHGHGAEPPPHGVLLALAAVGRRSLTCYLLQSVMLVPLLSPWALGLGVGAGTAFASAVAVGVYLVTVVVALALERAGAPGPAEWALRRLTYGRQQRARA